MPLYALFRLGFPSPSTVSVLSLPHTLTRWLILLKARRQGLPLRPVVSIQFQILFHSPRRGSFHLSLTVLLRYRSCRVFSLGGWTPQLPTILACIVVLRILRQATASTGFSPSLIDLPRSFDFVYRLWSPTTPKTVILGLGSSAFARHYSQNLLFSSPYLDVSVQAVPFFR